MENETTQAEGHAEDSYLDASDEQIDAMLRGDAPLQESEDDSEPDAEEGTEEGEDLADEPTPDEEPVKEFATREELQRLQELVNGQGKKLNGQELLLQRRASDIGEIKRQLGQFIETKEALLDDADPAVVAKATLAISKAEEKLAAAEAEEQDLGRVEANYKAVSTFVKPQEWDPEAMVVALQRDAQIAGSEMAPGFAESFMKDPRQFGSPDGLVHLAKRAFAEKIAIQAVAALQAMKKELDKKSQVKAEKVIQGVQGALRKPPPLTGGSGGAAKGAKNLKEIDPNSLSDAEIEKALAELR
jgi:hypothetical protein